MSDSWISWNPRTDEPSNGWPSSNFCSVSSWMGRLRCWTAPGRSVKRRSTMTAPSSLAMAMTSFGVATRLPLSLELRLAASLGVRRGNGVTATLTLRYTRNPPGYRGAEGVGFRVETGRACPGLSVVSPAGTGGVPYAPTCGGNEHRHRPERPAQERETEGDESREGD